METRIQISRGFLNVIQAGQGQGILFVHGFPLDHRMWSKQIEFFSNHFHVIAPDLNGFGKSSAIESTPYTMERFAEDLVELIEAIQVRTPIHVCGLSMGGYITWQLLKNHAKLIDRVVLANTRAKADDEVTSRGRRLVSTQVLKHGASEIAHSMPQKLVADCASLELRSELTEMIANTAPDSIAAGQLGMSIRPDMTEFLATVNVPALVIAGELDSITPASEMEEMANQMANSQFHFFPSVGHMTPMECPREFNEAMLEFLRAS